MSLEHRFHELEVQHTEATTLLHLQGTLIIDLQVWPWSHALYLPCSVSLKTDLKLKTCVLGRVCEESAPQSDTYDGSSAEKPRLLRQHRPSQHPDEHPGSSALRYALLHRPKYRHEGATQGRLCSVRCSACEELSHRLCLHLLQWSQKIGALHHRPITGRHASGGLL